MATSKVEVPQGGTAVVPSSQQRDISRLEKPRATGQLSSGVSTSATNPWLSPELGPSEEVEMSS